MNFNDFLSPISGIIIATIGVFSAWIAARQKTKSDQYAARGPEWDKFTEHYSKLVDRLRDEVDGLRGEVREVQQTLEKTRDNYWVAIGHIRDVHVHNPEMRVQYPIPAVIEPDVRI